MSHNITVMSRLINYLADNHSLQELVDCASELFGNPLLLTDSTMNLLAVCGADDIKDEIWNDFLSGNSRKKEYSDEKELISTMQTVMFQNEPVLTQYQDHKVNRIVSKVSSSGRILGYIVCLEHNNTFPKNILELAHIVCNALAIELQRTHSHFISEEASHTKVLKEILKGKEGINYSNKFLNTIFNHSEGSFYMVSIPFADNSFSSSKIAYLQQHIEKLAAYTYSVNLGTEIAILINISKIKLHALLRRFTSTLESHNLIGGISNSFINIQDIYYYYQQAVRAVKSGNLLGNKSIYYYPDIMIYDMLMTLSETVDIRQYQSSAITTLQQYDKKYGTEYLKTLESYLNHLGNITDISKELFTHRNTIIHRIQKIEEVCGLSLDDNEIRLKLEISLKIELLLSHNQ